MLAALLLGAAGTVAANGDCADVGENGVYVDPEKCVDRGEPVVADPHGAPEGPKDPASPA